MELSSEKNLWYRKETWREIFENIKILRTSEFLLWPAETNLASIHEDAGSILDLA